MGWPERDTPHRDATEAEALSLNILVLFTSSVWANASAGFSVVTYTGSTGNYTFGHGLGVTPKLVLIKNRSNSANWFVITNATGSWLYGHLNLTDALAGAAQSANSTVVDLVSNAFNWFNANGDNYVAYCFAPVSGYTRHPGSYCQPMLGIEGDYWASSSMAIARSSARIAAAFTSQQESYGRRGAGTT